VGRRSVNSVDSYAGGTDILTRSFLCGFPDSFQEGAGMVPALSHDRMFKKNLSNLSLSNHSTIRRCKVKSTVVPVLN
jgi:hypothetical protein